MPRCNASFPLLFFSLLVSCCASGLFLSEYRKTGVDGSEEAEYIPVHLRKQSPHHGDWLPSFVTQGRSWAVATCRSQEGAKISRHLFPESKHEFVKLVILNPANSLHFLEAFLGV